MCLGVVVRSLHNMWTGLVNLVYPPRCLSCDARTPTSGLPLCSRCLRQPEPASAEAVLRHIQRLPAPTEALDAAVALWRFDKDGTLQHVQHALKYGNRPRYGFALGRLMASCIDDAEPAPDAVVPVPLHRARQYERGYNQSAMLAQGLAAELDAPLHPGWLVRPHATPPQAQLARAARWSNVAQAFRAPHPAATRDASILLVDDVITTGSTAVAAATTLKEAGAAHVTLCALAFARG